MGYIGPIPAQVPLTSSDIGDGIITADKLATDAVETAKVKDVNVTAGKLATTQDLSSKTITLPATVAGLGTGINVTNQITGVVPAANLGSGTASSSTYLAGDSTYKTISEYDDDKLQSNIALLGFKTAVNGSLAKYNLQDQIIDEFTDATGIDAGNSTNERLTSGVYDGGVDSTPSVTQDADATGTDGDYTWYKWTDTGATGSYETDVTQDHEYLIVGGGAGGASVHAGGGGAGGVLAATGLSLTGGNEYTVTVGAGGASAGTYTFADGSDGDDSILSGTGITTLTAGGGGGGSYYLGSAGAGRATNGNGGGGGCSKSGGAGDGAGYAGGAGIWSTENPAGGGGGASEAGDDGVSGKGGDGGDGVANDIIETGTDVYYAGGGGGASYDNDTNAGAGGNGGGGAGSDDEAAIAGTANTGGGGGGSHNGASGAGGSGIVILRRLTTATSGGEDLTLQSTANTASTSSTKADLIMLMENGAGTASINVDIKGYVTANGGTNWTEGTLVDEGTWGTNKKIYAFHDATVTGGTDMRYKITTHNQSAGSKETKIHAVSLGWKAS